MKAILFDLDGVFYEGDKPVPGAAEVAAWVKAQNIPHRFLTNTTSQPRAALLKKLAAFGIETDDSHILTPPVAAAHWLHGKNITGKLALFVPEATRDEFNAFDISPENEDDVAAVIIGDLGEQWNFATLNRAFRLLIREPRPAFIALGMTRYWQAPEGLRLDVAPFVVALEHASGVQPVVTGKPAAAFFQTALDQLHVKAEETVMIGDDIRGDIEGAQQAGCRAILVKTGKFRPADLTKNITPDAVLDSVRELPQWWQSQ